MVPKRRSRSDTGPSKSSYFTRRSSTASSAALQSLAEVELCSVAAERGPPGWKRLTDENEGTPEKAQAGRDLAENGTMRKRMLGEAQHSLAQKPANVRAVPKIFPH